MQHITLCVSPRSVADEAETKNLLYGSPEAVMWERWKKGESLHQIAELFNRNHSSIQRILAQSGGIRPAQRRRSSLALSLAEREEISRSLASGHTIRLIAQQLGRAPSTISREINRNGGQTSYRASCAEDAAWKRALRPKSCKLVDNPVLAHIVATNSKYSGRHSKLPVGSSILLQRTRTTRCRMKRFIVASSFKPVAL